MVSLFFESERLFLLFWNTINLHLAWETNVGDVMEWYNHINNPDAGRGYKGFARLVLGRTSVIY